MRAVPSDKIDAAWPRVAPLLRQFLSKYPDAWTVGQAYDLLMSSHRQLYVVVDGREIVAAIITQITDDGGTLEILNVAGRDSKDWADGVLLNLEQTARENGVKSLRRYDRPGWAKVIGATPSEGWVQRQIVYEKVL